MVEGLSDVPGSEDSSELTSAEDWEAAPCVPRSGNGTLARMGQVVLLVAQADQSDVSPLLDHVEMVAQNGSGGRQLVRGFALQLVSMAGDPPPFVAMAPVAAGMAVFASGAASVFVDGQEVTGRDSLAWAERVFPWPVREIEGRVDDTAVAISSLLDLRQGIVNAGAFAVLAGVPQNALAAPAVADVATEPEVEAAFDSPAESQDAPAAPMEPAHRDLQQVTSEQAVPKYAEPQQVSPEAMEPAHAEPIAPEPIAPEPGRPVHAGRPHVEEPPAQFESIVLGPGGAVDLVDTPPPLPIIGDRHDLPSSSADASQVKGVFCKNHHFNDPRMLFCAVCGINMVQQTPVLVKGLRPPLGVIVLDDGAVFQLDTNYLLGRDPDSDDLVRDGQYRGIQVSDNQNMISRVHARLELRTWDVVLVDNASTNGTFFAEAGSAEWKRLPQGGDTLLAPGTRVRIGHRMLAFNTHRGN